MAHSQGISYWQIEIWTLGHKHGHNQGACYMVTILHPACGKSSNKTWKSNKTRLDYTWRPGFVWRPDWNGFVYTCVPKIGDCNQDRLQSSSPQTVWICGSPRFAFVRGRILDPILVLSTMHALCNLVVVDDCPYGYNVGRWSQDIHRHIVLRS